MLTLFDPVNKPIDCLRLLAGTTDHALSERKELGPSTARKMWFLIEPEKFIKSKSEIFSSSKN